MRILVFFKILLFKVSQVFWEQKLKSAVTHVCDGKALTLDFGIVNGYLYICAKKVKLFVTLLENYSKNINVFILSES